MKKGVDYIGITCVFYCHDGKGNFVMHKRSQNCKDEQGVWDVGGGSLEFGESPEEAVKREVKEEYGVDALNIKFAGVHNVLRENNGQKTHWLALIYLVLVDPKKVKIGEPTKMDELKWFKMWDWPDQIHSQLLWHYELVKRLLAK